MNDIQKNILQSLLSNNLENMKYWFLESKKVNSYFDNNFYVTFFTKLNTKPYKIEFLKFYSANIITDCDKLVQLLLYGLDKDIFNIQDVSIIMEHYSENLADNKGFQDSKYIIQFLFLLLEKQKESGQDCTFLFKKYNIGGCLSDSPIVWYGFLSKIILCNAYQTAEYLFTDYPQFSIPQFFNFISKMNQPLSSYTDIYQTFLTVYVNMSPHQQKIVKKEIEENQVPREHCIYSDLEKIQLFKELDHQYSNKTEISDKPQKI